MSALLAAFAVTSTFAIGVVVGYRYGVALAMNVAANIHAKAISRLGISPEKWIEAVNEDRS